jgi:hypothetical protein
MRRAGVGIRRRDLRAAIGAAAAIVMAVVIARAPLAHAAAAGADNLFQNADLSKGAGNSPDHWRTEGWDQKPTTTDYQWRQNLGEVDIDSSAPNDARWMQSLSLSNGWYYFSVEARTEGVPDKEAGATISVMEDGITSKDLKGTTDWTKIGLYLNIGHLGADLEIALRLGGYGSLNTGHAFFRNPSVVRVPAAPKGAEHVFDLEAIRQAAQPKPIGRPWTLVVLFIVLGVTAVYGWQLYGEASLPSTRPVGVPPPPTPIEKPRAERRRAEKQATGGKAAKTSATERTGEGPKPTPGKKRRTRH